MTIRPFTGGSEGGQPPAGGAARADDARSDDSHAEPSEQARLLVELSDPSEELIEPGLDDSVAEAILGDASADNNEAQPDRKLCSTSDFASIYIRSRSALEYRARSFLSDPRDIEEVVQETFLRLVLAMPELEYEWQAHAFCRRALTNLCIDRYRRDRRRPQVYDLDAGNVIDIAADEYADHPVLRAEDAAIVREALAHLSPLHRAALVKREIEEKPLSVIATELDVPEESVKHLLFRARRSLRRLLTGSAVDPEADLTFVELASVANKRLAQATLRSAHVLVIVVTAALVVAAGSHGLLPHRTLAQAHGTSARQPTPDHPRRERPAKAPRQLAKPSVKQKAAAPPSGETVVPGSPQHQSAPSSGAAPSKPGTTVPVVPAPQHSNPPPSAPPVRDGSGPFHSSQAAGAKGPYTVTVNGQTYTAAAAMHTRPAGQQTASGSDLSVPNATKQGGSYAVSQQLVSAPTNGSPQIQQASVQISLPVLSSDGSAGQAEYSLNDPDVSVDSMSDGTIRVTMAGTASASPAAPADAPAAVDVSVAVNYLPGLAGINGEQVTLAPFSGVGPFAAAPSAFSRVAQPLLALLTA